MPAKQKPFRSPSKHGQTSSFSMKRLARRVAARLGLRRIGVLGLLVEAKRRGLIPFVKPILDSLLTKAGFWVEEALRQAHEIPYRFEQAEVRRWYARMLRERDDLGDRDRARKLLEESLPIYEDIGMPRHRELAQSILPNG
jgi:hypothetical protein